jgi:uncharacterized protein (DUF433 family)
MESGESLRYDVCSTKGGSSLLTETRYEHIALNEDRVPVIAGTTMKVVELILDHLAYGWSPEELRFQHPSLSMGQVHSALAYYWDHKPELDQDIERRLQLVDQIQRTTPASPLVEKLKARGRG